MKRIGCSQVAFGFALALGCSNPPLPPSCSTPTGGPTTHGADILVDETWSAATSPHVVTSVVRVRGTATLTIEPCAEVRLQAAAGIVVGLGGDTSTLVAQGDAARPIRFVRDGTSPWANLGAYDPGRARLAYATLEGGGSDSARWNASLVAWGSGLGTPLAPVVLVDHVTIRQSVGVGVTVENRGTFAQGSTDLTVTASGNSASPGPLRAWAVALGSIPTGSYTGNLADEILVDYMGDIPEDVTVHDRGVPYHFGVGAGPSSRLLVAGPDAVTPAILTVEPGVVIRVEPPTYVRFGQGSASRIDYAGALVAAGTPAAPIVFSSAAAVPAAGDWAGLHFEGNAGPSLLDNVRIEYAGGVCLCSSATCAPTIADPENAALLIFDFPPANEFLTNSTISDSAGHGVMRGWTAPGNGGPDFLPTNTFVNVAGCRETVPRDPVGGCSAVTSCP